MSWGQLTGCLFTCWLAESAKRWDESRWETGSWQSQVRRFRGALIRPFESKGIDIGLNFFIASGYGGQTLEILPLRGEASPFERITGLPLKSYVTASFTYHFRGR